MNYFTGNFNITFAAHVLRLFSRIFQFSYSLCASQIHEALNSLLNFALITGNQEMQHIAIKASKTAEMELTWTAQ